MPTRIHIYTHRDLMKEATCIHSYYPYSPQSWEHSPGSTWEGREGNQRHSNKTGRRKSLLFANGKALDGKHKIDNRSLLEKINTANCRI